MYKDCERELTKVMRLLVMGWRGRLPKYLNLHAILICLYTRFLVPFLSGLELQV